MTKHDPMCRMATGASEVFCDCSLIWRVESRERARIVEKARADARNAMEAARNAASHEAWATAAGFRVQANTLREFAVTIQEAGE